MTMLFQVSRRNLKIPDIKCSDFFDEIESVLDKYGLCLLTHVMGEEILKYGIKGLEDSGLDVFNEDVLPVGMKLNEKQAYLVKCLEKIGTRGNELYIIDGYIFPIYKKYAIQRKRRMNNDYIFLEKIFQEANPSKTIFITQKDYNKKLFTKISKKIKCDLIINENSHDRFWIVPATKKGFLVGTSPNGFKKMFTIKQLDLTEIEVIFKDLNIDFDAQGKEEAHHGKENQIPASNEK